MPRKRNKVAIAAVVPIIGQVAALVAPILPDIIRGIEQVFKAPKSGQDRMDAATQAIRAVVDKAVARGEVGGSPTDAEIRALIEATFQRMKAEGQLTAAPVVKVPESGVYLLRGRLVPIPGIDLT